MTFIELSTFTRSVYDCMDDDDLAELQAWLSDNPESGDLIPGSGGLRKLRWSGSGRGKRGGSRIIYYYAVPSMVYLVLAYLKNRMEDLMPGQLKTLSAMVKEATNG